ncbi:FIMAH domain-containing protein [Virgibacillus salarius]|uniref:FIMAH domain-containing protein n=2 Tax=Virgibacillus TaxID=84406 RepID=UPI003CD0D282
MKELVAELVNQGEIINGERKLTMHLTAVSRYEQTGLSDKVIKHMDSFQRLLEHQLENDAISEKAFSYLDTQAILLIEHWQSQ